MHSARIASDHLGKRERSRAGCVLGRRSPFRPLVGALVSFESMVTVAATLVFLALVLLGVKIYFKWRLAVPEAE